MGLGLAKSAPELCREMFKYHLWRQAKVSNMLMEVDAALWSKQLTGSFSSLKGILDHIVWVEMGWLRRVDDTQAAPSETYDVKGMLEMWKRTSARWHEILVDSEDADFKKLFVYFDFEGERFEISLAKIVLQVIDHCSYHIGQMMNTIRGFGMEPIPTGLTVYLRA